MNEFIFTDEYGNQVSPDSVESRDTFDYYTQGLELGFIKETLKL